MRSKPVARILLAVFSMVITTSCGPQSPPIEWQLSAGGSLFDEARCILQTTDGGYVATGPVNSLNGDVTGNHGATDFWVLKINEYGQIQWKECFGGDYFDQPIYCALTNDGGFIVVGHTYSFTGDIQGNHGGSDIWVLKLDRKGKVQWKKALGGSGHEYASRILQHKDGTFLISGSADSKDGDVRNYNGNQNGWLVKLNATGNIIWQKLFGGTVRENITSIALTTDGGYILTESIFSKETDSGGNALYSDYQIIKLDEDGNPEWQKKYGDTQSKYPHVIIQTRDGGFAISGSFLSHKKTATDKIMQYDGWMMKLDAKTNLEWEKFYGGMLSEHLGTLSQTSDGGFITGGWSYSADGDVKGNHGLSDYWLLRLNERGDVQWAKSMGGSDDDDLVFLQPTADGGYILCGHSASNDGDVTGNHGNEDMWIVKLKSVN